MGDIAMAAADKPETRKPARGRVQFELQGNGKTVAVHLDRSGFRRLLETLEQLAETGERQSFAKSGRARPGGNNGSVTKGDGLAKLVFHIDSDS
jgi:hypothetical protein